MRLSPARRSIAQARTQLIFAATSLWPPPQTSGAPLRAGGGLAGIAIAHGCAASSSNVVRRPDGSVSATGTVVHMDNGVVVPARRAMSAPTSRHGSGALYLVRQAQGATEAAGLCDPRDGPDPRHLPRVPVGIRARGDDDERRVEHDARRGNGGQQRTCNHPGADAARTRAP